MLEHRIIAAIAKDKTAYEVFNRIGDREALSPIGKRVLELISAYRRHDESRDECELPVIQERTLRGLANDKHHAGVIEYFREVDKDSSPANLVADLRAIHKQKYGGLLSLALANGAAEKEVQKLIETFQQGFSEVITETSQESLVDVFNTDDLTEAKGVVDYIRLWPKALNDQLDGGALRGHHVLIYARPEMGKTLFTINLVAGFMHQNISVLYVANEEPVADIRDRIRGRLLKWSKNDVRSKRAEAAERLGKAQLGQVRVTGGASTFRAVRGLVTAIKPDVVIFDQLRNMRVEGDGKTAQLEVAAAEARKIAKDFNVLVLSVTQAGDSATGKVYLDMSDVDSSKTGIPGAADLMIGLGADSAMAANGLLGVSLPKNKLSGLHSHFTLTANPLTGVVGNV